MPFQAAVLKVWLIPGYIVTVVEIRKACGVIWANVVRAPQIEANQILDYTTYSEDLQKQSNLSRITTSQVKSIVSRSIDEVARALELHAADYRVRYAISEFEYLTYINLSRP